MDKGITHRICGKNINEETVLEVGKFAILWNVFEKTKCRESCQADKIMEIAQASEQSCKKIFIEFAKTLNNRAKPKHEYIDEQDKRIHIHCYVDNGLFPNQKSKDGITRDNRKYGIDIVEKIIDYIISVGERSIDGGLFAIWAIRNNMFHGSKEHGNLNEQINLFKSMNAVLKEVNI